MKKGEKYTLEIEEIYLNRDTGKEYAKMKGFNTLFFDEEGLSRLPKLSPVDQGDLIDQEAISELADTTFRNGRKEGYESGYHDGYYEGMQDAWRAARTVSETSARQLKDMGFKMKYDYDESSEYEVSCGVIMANTPEEVIDRFNHYKKTDVNVKRVDFTTLEKLVSQNMPATASPYGSHAFVEEMSVLFKNVLKDLYR